ncbi:hypothetical protein AURDEDRAFT_170871 [Auricularia subglabra TFB-10046 SS5]|nr:hypothetical protein AURDEDRAFT_170871 [Auricularia subglabra TFB-10046 SS5]
MSFAIQSLCLVLFDWGFAHACTRSDNWSYWLPSPPGSHRIAAAAPQHPTLGPLGVFDMNVRGASRGQLYSVRLREFANGTAIPLGQYKVLLRALRPFGDPEKAEDYDVHVSVQFGWVA